MTIPHFDLPELIKTVGYLGLFAIVFAESGLLIGFFLPGDSLLFTAGFLASQNFLHIGWLIVCCVSAAIIGDSVGYSFGYRLGPRIFKKEDSIFFSKKNIYRTQAFFDKHGGKALILARFVPVVRTFAPIMAGVGKMSYRHFLSYNIIGGLVWGAGMPLLGYYLGKSIPNIDKYLLPIVAAIIILSLAPTLWHIMRDAETRAHIREHGTKFYNRLVKRN